MHRGNASYYGNPSTSEVRVYDPEGKLVRIVRSSDVPDRITPWETEQRLGMTIPRNVSAAERTARMNRMRAMPHSSTWPAYMRMHVDPAGQIWLEDYPVVLPSSGAWTAFDSTGRLVGRVVIPASPKDMVPPEVIDFGRGNVLVRRIDTDGASWLTVYPLVPVHRR